MDAGVTLLADVAVSYVEYGAGDITERTLAQVRDIFTRFLKHELSLADAEHLLSTLVPYDTTLTRLQEIISVPDDPLPIQTDGPAAENPRRRTRPWTTTEDQRLLCALLRFGPDNWQAISQFIGNGRSRAQCSQRWYRGLNPRISKKAWTPAEEQRLHELVDQYGERNWAKIASVLGNRSDVQVRYHYLQIEESGLSMRGAVKGSGSDHAISLHDSRKSGSSPNLGLPLVIPMSPVTCRLRGPEGALCGAARTEGWGVCGADAKSLDIFLGNFL
jgi:hypothetical protein